MPITKLFASVPQRPRTPKKGGETAKKCGVANPVVSWELVKFMGPSFAVPFQRSTGHTMPLPLDPKLILLLRVSFSEHSLCREHILCHFYPRLMCRGHSSTHKAFSLGVTFWFNDNKHITTTIRTRRATFSLSTSVYPVM